MENDEKKNEQGPTCSNVNLEAVVRFDEKGQLVLPKEVRQKAGIEANDKLAIISCGDDENICCLTIMKNDQLQSVLKDVMEPLLKGLSREEEG